MNILDYINRINELYGNQEPRNMYSQGQLVTPNVDGSRPGYKGTKEIGSGKFSIADRNRATRIKYPKYNSYLELLKKEPTKAKNVMAILQYSSVSGSKIKKKTHLTRLTKIQENKILAEFPDAVFSDGQKFGFNSTSDQTKFVQVKRFIKRGYKPKFKQIPEKVQKELKEKFSHFKDWDFKKYKYGVPDSATIKENNRLAQKVKTYINDPKPWKFGFSLDQKGGWLTGQMYRAWEHGNTDYEPKYNKNGKVIGMYEKGNLYYANENVAPSKKANLILSHPEFNKIQKFVDVANEAKLPLKKLGDYKNTKSLLALFPEGYEKIKFSDLTNYLYREAGADVTRNAIEKHHLKALSDMGSATDAKNLQLLRQDLNTLGNTIAEQIKKGDFSKVADLEKAGVKITVDGKTYGTGFQNPRRQLNVLIGETTKKIQSLDEKKLIKLFRDLCPKGKASGGRIGYQGGTAVTGTLQCGINQFNKNMKTGNANSALMRRILANGGNILKEGAKSLNPADLLKLRNLIGPQALGFFAGWELGEITTDNLRKGTPWNEAFAKNWLTKSFMPFTQEFAKQKNLLQSGKLNTDAQRIYALDMMKAEKLWKEMDRIEGMEAGQILDQSGYGMIDGSPVTSQEDIDAAKSNVTRIIEDLESRGSLENTGVEMENIKAMEEKEATEMAKDDWKPIRHMFSDNFLETLGIGKGFEDPFEPKVTRGKRIARAGKNAIVGHKVDYSRPSYIEADTTPLNKRQLQEETEILKHLGYIHPISGKMPKWYEEELQQDEKWRQLFKQNPSGLLGTQYNADGGRAGYMGGGIAAIRKPHAIPPEKGGLRSIMINGKKS